MESAIVFHKRRIGQIVATLEDGEKSHALDYHRRELKKMEDEKNNPVKLGYCPIRGVYIEEKYIG